ncbi:MAG: MBL fold metallo-hydrolase [Actinobacteria bacterium]|nr:MBL fold metallo-hydrolase [Actinomycetota bacterium]
MRVRRLTLGPLDTNCWLVDDAVGGPALVIDPADEPQVILDALSPRAVEAVVLTHCHFDHLAAAGAVLRASGARLLVPAADAAYITDTVGTGAALFGFSDVAPEADGMLAEGDVICAGELRLSVLETPGHTPGSICLLSHGHLIAGDTLFAGSIGRTDFPRGDMSAMRRSIARLAELPDETVVHPGHGPETTIGRERRVNPFFPRA